MKDKLFHLSFSNEVENTNEWKVAFREEGYVCLTDIPPSNIVVFVGEKIDENDWELARSFKKLIYNLTCLPVDKGMEMLKILMDNTDWGKV